MDAMHPAGARTALGGVADKKTRELQCLTSEMASQATVGFKGNGKVKN